MGRLWFGSIEAILNNLIHNFRCRQWYRWTYISDPIWKGRWVRHYPWALMKVRQPKRKQFISFKIPSSIWFLEAHRVASNDWWNCIYAIARSKVFFLSDQNNYTSGSARHKYINPIRKFNLAFIIIGFIRVRGSQRGDHIILITGSARKSWVRWSLVHILHWNFGFPSPFLGFAGIMSFLTWFLLVISSQHELQRLLCFP